MKKLTLGFRVILATLMMLSMFVYFFLGNNVIFRRLLTNIKVVATEGMSWLWTKIETHFPMKQVSK